MDFFLRFTRKWFFQLSCECFLVCHLFWVSSIETLTIEASIILVRNFAFSRRYGLRNKLTWSPLSFKWTGKFWFWIGFSSLGCFRNFLGRNKKGIWPELFSLLGHEDVGTAFSYRPLQTVVRKAGESEPILVLMETWGWIQRFFTTSYFKSALISSPSSENW